MLPYPASVLLLHHARSLSPEGVTRRDARPGKGPVLLRVSSLSGLNGWQPLPSRCPSVPSRPYTKPLKPVARQEKAPLRRETHFQQSSTAQPYAWPLAPFGVVAATTGSAVTSHVSE